MKSTGFWAAARNAALKVVAFWVLLFAAYLAIGRQFFPYISNLEPEIEVWLTEQLGTSVSIGQIKGEWVRFNPVIHLSDVTLGDDLSVANMTLAPGIYESLSRGGLSFIRFELIDFEAELIETESGWQMLGIASERGSARIDLQQVLALIQRQEEVQFTNTHLTIRPLSLPSFELTLNDGRLSGYGTDNGLVATATLTANNLDVPIELQVETTEQAAGLNRLYLRHGNIDLSPWLGAVNDRIVTAQLAGEYWINLQGDQWQNATLRLDAEELLYQGDQAALNIRNAKLETYLHAENNGFEAWLNLLEFSVNNQSFGSTQGKFSHRANRFKFQWDSLPANVVGRWFELTDPGEFWQSLSPTGFLEQGVATFTQSEPQSLRVTAQIADFAMQSYRGIPSLNNLQGELKMQGASGEMVLRGDDVTFSMPGLYDQAFDTDVSQASLRWDTESDKGIFATGSADLILQPPLDSQVREPLSVTMNWMANTPTVDQKAEGRESTLEYQLSANEVSRNWALVLTDNKLVSPNTVALLDRRLEQATFENFRLNYLNHTPVTQVTESQFFIQSNFKDAQISFLDDWFAVEQVKGRILLDNQGIKISGLNATYPGFQIPKLSLDLNYQQAKMDVALELASDMSSMMDFLQTGPLRRLYGDNLDQWYGRGAVLAHAEISVPLSNPSDFQADVDVDFNDNELVMSDIAMGFSDIRGRLQVSTERGLQTQGLKLTHLDRDQQVTVRSDLNPDNPVFTITASGQTPLVYWGERFDDAFLKSQTVDIAHDTTIVVTGSEVTIQTLSDGLNLALDLPAPMKKSELDSWPLQMRVVMDNRDWTRVQLNLNNHLDAFFELDQNNAIQRGTVAVDRPLNIREDNGVYFDVQAGEVDGDDWWQAIQSLRALYSTEGDVDTNSDTNSNTPSFESLIQSIHIQADNINYLSQPWQMADVTLLRNDDAWLVEFNAEQGQGEVLVPHSDEPIFASVEWVSLTTGEEEIPFEKAIDPLLEYMPSDVPDMQVLINKLIWNQRDLGHWRAQLVLDDDKLHVRDIVGEMKGATLSGALDWSKPNGKHRTEFVGQIQLRNILDVLNTWEYAPVLTSREGLVNINTFWQGSPAFFDFKRLQGQIDLNLQNGSILQVDEYEGIKLIGLLNFTRVIQRIALDFSDLLQSGITFDAIEGQLLFDRGFARVGEKLIIDGSATKFRFSGDADLLSDELDIDMVLTVPLSSTFPLVALLAGVSPQAAAAIYVTERVFNNELERLSSARMHITGSFSEPETRFYRVFDNAIGNDNPSVGDRIKDVVPEGVSP